MHGQILDKYNLLYESQYGFQLKRSYEHAMLELIGNILQFKNNKLHLAAMFLDLSKAFDTLNHEVLLKS